MTLRNLFIVNAVVAFVFGVAFVLVPTQLVSLYGGTLGDEGTYIGRLMGAAFLGWSVLTWFARNVTDSEALRAIVLANFVGNAIGFILALRGQLAPPVYPLGWSNVVIYLLLALGYGYFQFLRPTGS